MTTEVSAGGRVAQARERWADYRWTNALLATTDTDEPNPASGPLSGLVCTVKDTFAAAGLASTGGSLLLEGHVPARDAVLIGRLKAAGATLFAKGNCAEFGNGIHTETRIGGRVLHPDDPNVSPGGSSGGDAVAVAAGISDFSIGGDYGGSVRWPAQNVGLYGLRTSAGLVPRTGRMPSGGGTRSAPFVGPPAPLGLLSRVEVPGIFARSPELVARVVEVLGGPDGDDWWGLAGPTPPTVRHGRIAVTTGRECGPVHEEALDALATARAAAVRAGYQIVEVEGLLADATELYNQLRDDLDVLDDLRELVGPDIDLVCPGTRAVLESPRGRGWAHPEVRRNWAVSRRIIGRVKAVFDSVDALLLPVAAVSAVAHDGGVEVDGQLVAGPALMAQCRAISLTGLPALAVPVVPLGPNRAVGVQIVGPAGGDLQCCRIAAELARELSPGHGPGPAASGDRETAP